MTGRSESNVPALTVGGLGAFYGKSQVLFDVDLSVGAGEAVTLLGRNGAGKTSTLLAISGLISTRCKSLRLGEEDIRRRRPFERARDGLSLVPAGFRVFPNLTVEENLAMVRSDRAARLDEVYTRFPQLTQLKNTMAGLLSGGERQMLAIGRALTAKPRVLMLDEPSEGLAPKAIAEVVAILNEMKRDGLSILFAEQSHNVALRIADRVYFIEKGQIAWAGTPDEARSPATLRRYLAL